MNTLYSFFSMNWFSTLQLPVILTIVDFNGSNLDNGRNFIFCITRESVFHTYGHLELYTGRFDFHTVRTETAGIAFDQAKVRMRLPRPTNTWLNN